MQKRKVCKKKRALCYYCRANIQPKKHQIMNTNSVT